MSNIHKSTPMPSPQASTDQLLKDSILFNGTQNNNVNLPLTSQYQPFYRGGAQSRSSTLGQNTRVNKSEDQALSETTSPLKKPTESNEPLVVIDANNDVVAVDITTIGGHENVSPIINTESSNIKNTTTEIISLLQNINSEEIVVDHTIEHQKSGSNNGSTHTLSEYTTLSPEKPKKMDDIILSSNDTVDTGDSNISTPIISQIQHIDTNITAHDTDHESLTLTLASTHSKNTSPSSAEKSLQTSASVSSSIGPLSHPTHTKLGEKKSRTRLARSANKSMRSSTSSRRSTGSRRSNSSQPSRLTSLYDDDSDTKPLIFSLDIDDSTDDDDDIKPRTTDMVADISQVPVHDITNNDNIINDNINDETKSDDEFNDNNEYEDNYDHEYIDNVNDNTNIIVNRQQAQSSDYYEGQNNDEEYEEHEDEEEEDEYDDDTDTDIDVDNDTDYDNKDATKDDTKVDTKDVNKDDDILYISTSILKKQQQQQHFNTPQILETFDSILIHQAPTPNNDNINGNVGLPIQEIVIIDDNCTVITVDDDDDDDDNYDVRDSQSLLDFISVEKMKSKSESETFQPIHINTNNIILNPNNENIIEDYITIIPSNIPHATIIQSVIDDNVKDNEHDVIDPKLLLQQRLEVPQHSYLDDPNKKQLLTSSIPSIPSQHTHTPSLSSHLSYKTTLSQSPPQSPPQTLSSQSQSHSRSLLQPQIQLHTQPQPQLQQPQQPQQHPQTHAKIHPQLQSQQQQQQQHQQTQQQIQIQHHAQQNTNNDLIFHPSNDIENTQTTQNTISLTRANMKNNNTHNRGSNPNTLPQTRIPPTNNNIPSNTPPVQPNNKPNNVYSNNTSSVNHTPQTLPHSTSFQTQNRIPKNSNYNTSRQNIILDEDNTSHIDDGHEVVDEDKNKPLIHQHHQQQSFDQDDVDKDSTHSDYSQDIGQNEEYDSGTDEGNETSDTDPEEDDNLSEQESDSTSVVHSQSLEYKVEYDADYIARRNALLKLRNDIKKMIDFYRCIIRLMTDDENTSIELFKRDEIRQIGLLITNYINIEKQMTINFMQLELPMQIKTNKERFVLDSRSSIIEKWVSDKIESETMKREIYSIFEEYQLSLT